MIGLLRLFWEQGDEWRAAEEALAANTAESERIVSPADEALAASAEKEVACWRAAFADDLPRAVGLAQEVTDRLIGGDELRPYRALWFYLAASWAGTLAAADPGEWAARAAELRREADGSARTLRWTPRWSDAATIDEQATPEVRGTRAAAKLRRLGIRGGRFEAHVTTTAAKLASDTATDFEDGLQRLGDLLGFEAVRPSGQADPDSAWRDGTADWLLFEAKTEERPDTPLSADAVRQASTHEQWVRSVLEWEPAERTMTAIVTHKASVDAAAPGDRRQVRMVSIDGVRDVADRTFAALREVRATARGLSDDELAARMTDAFAARGLDTPSLAHELGPRLVADG